VTGPGCALQAVRAPGPGTNIPLVQRVHRESTRVLSALLVVVGVAMVVSAIARGGGALSVGVLTGALLALLGAGRLYLARSAGEPGERA
jgi:hypothetical protein